MPTRFLSDEQRDQYGRYVASPSEDQLARYFHVDEADRALIGELRGTHNRVGFALQLGTVRFLGIFPDEGMTIPPLVITTLARQLGDDPTLSLETYWRGRQRWRHVALIRKRYGFRDFNSSADARFSLARWLYALCWAGDDRPGLLLERATHWLMTHKILLPGVSTLERLIARIRHRVRDKRWRALAGAFTPDQQHQIGQLFVDDGSGKMALDDLRAAPRQLAPGELIRHLERIDAIRNQDLTFSTVAGVPEAVIERLARSGRMMRATALARLPELRRSATLVALFHHLEAIALDDALDLFEGLMSETVSDAAKAYNASRMRSLRDLDAAALLLADVAELVIAEPAEGQPVFADERGVLLDRTSRDDIRAAMRRTRDLARPPDDRHFDELCVYWRRVHRLFSNLLRRITFDANPAGQSVKEALEFLSSVENWTRGSMSGAPTACVSNAWERHVFSGGDRRVTDNRAFVFAILEAMRKALKRRDIFARPSLRFADPTRGLLDDKSWRASRHTILRALGRSEDARFEITQLGRQLDRAYHRVVDNLPRNADLRFDKGELILTQLDKLEEPPNLIALRRDIQDRLPKVGLPDILLETAARTGFPAAFTHVSEQRARVEGFEISLCAALIAEACNIGFEPMTRQDHVPLRRERLSWVSQNFIRDETLKAANARIVEAYDALPITRAWGAGDVASADGVRFVVRGNPIHAGPNPKYFGIKRGITWYNLVSDQSAGLGGISVPGTLRDSMVILGLMLEQETHLEPTEIMTDTAAYSDVVFGLFWLLGYQFSPRLADIGGARFWRIDKQADYGPFDAISRHRVDIDLIEKCWDDLLRLAASLKLGRIQASAIMRVLQIKDRPTALARALAELGRLIKTLHVLNYIDDPEKRRRILTQLNRHEFRHRLARRICHGRRGEIGATYREGQEQKLGALGLVLNIIAFWNATYIQAAVDTLEHEGRKIETADLTRVSPLPHRHINVLGRYVFSLPDAIANGELRPLRNPNYE